MKKVIITAIGGLALTALALSGCSGSSSGGSGGDNGRGPITFVQGKDNSNIIATLAAQWNAKHPNEKVTVKQQSDKADQQHDDLVQHFQAKSTDYDVVTTDVIWTAEFAAKGWLTPLEGSLKLDTSSLLPATVKTATYQGKLYGGPYASDGGILYYRSDLLKTPPKTWDELMADCSIAKKAHIKCYAGQFAQYEGLTVNFAESVNGAGGEIVKSDGKTPNLETPQALAGLNQLVSAFKDGNIPAENKTFQEEQGRQAFEAGQYLFMRNWPYAYSLAKTDSTSKVKNTVAIAPLVTNSSLGGHNLAISAYSKHKATALDFIKFMESPEVQKEIVLKASLSPVIASLYTDPTLVKAAPYLPVLKESILKAVPRPVTPFYPAVTQAIQENAFQAISGSVTPDQALKNMQAAITSAGSGN
ncbi:MAG TPA: ABC transporter substrate-binding protein [Microbacterium sp.]|uniref:ABC transporter substrate-binding protein n=1 Tax=Microbacterium sp. TaxID=51671 RepID=UPI002B45F5CB|nr:ABC transporter substrate-binding protein [Microbacterium sp.]HKT55601.1 ABC transporter substrate-binding protein [Microbacterium sp.]